MVIRLPTSLVLLYIGNGRNTMLTFASISRVSIHANFYVYQSKYKSTCT
uniref:Uncharacterized protein n=1 Tax=Arundo donax TaxID=35708 RepID=A0A0A9CG40_ARUDO